MSDIERSLGDAPEPQDVPAAISSDDSEDFDFGEFVGGFRATRRRIKLYPDAHLIDEMESVADRIEATPEGENVDELIDRYEALKAEFEAGRWFVVEKRSSEWVRALARRAAEAEGITLDEDGATESVEDRTTLLCHQIAEQVVEPEGLTADAVRALYDANEGEFNKLAMLVADVNTRLAQGAEVLRLDFSQRRSGRTGTRRTSAR